MLPRPVEGAYLAAMTYASSSIPRLLERALVLRNVLMVTYHYPIEIFDHHYLHGLNHVMYVDE